MDFLAIDVETANSDQSSICQIGLVRFEAGLAVDRFSLLVDPDDEFDPINVQVHGIRPEDVVGAPKFPYAFDVFAGLLRSSVVVHHTHFDRVAILRATERHGLACPDCRWLDTARVVRRTWEHRSRSGYGLADVCAELGIIFKHHDAAEDAAAAGWVLLKAIEHSGRDLDAWLDHVTSPISAPYSSRVARSVEDAEGTIVFTGELSMRREEAAGLAAEAGFNVEDGVNKRTTLLVVGDQDVRRLRGAKISSKHAKAKAMIEKGAPIRIVSERDFLTLVENRS